MSTPEFMHSQHDSCLQLFLRRHRPNSLPLHSQLNTQVRIHRFLSSSIRAVLVGVVSVCLMLQHADVASAKENEPLLKPITDEPSRCANAFVENNWVNTVHVCVEELIAPVTFSKRMAIMELLGSAYLAQQEHALAHQTWHEAAERIHTPKKNAQDLSERWVRLRILAAQALAAQDEHQQAIQYLIQTRQRLQSEWGSHTHLLAPIEDELGLVYAWVGERQLADDAYRKARIVLELKLGKHHPDVMQVRIHHAVALMDMQRVDVAQEHLNAINELMQNHDDLQHAAVRAEALTLLGTINMQQGHLAHALSQYETALDIRAQQFGPNHLKTSQAHNNIGVVLFRLGQFAKAKQHLSQAHQVRLSQLGANDPLTQSTKKNLDAVEHRKR